MVKAAFFSDVHGNLPALVSFFADSKKRGAAGVYGAGDYVGFGPSPAETVHLLKGLEERLVRGNLDERIARLGYPAAGAEVDDVFAWTAARLGEADRKWLGTLPEQLFFTLDGVRVMVVHGSPLSSDDGIGRAITATELEAKMPAGPVDLLVCAHTHIPFVREIGGVTVVNCGSVGRPFDGDPRGSYALVEFDRGAAAAQVIRFAYPVEELVREIVESRAPGVRAAQYREGRLDPSV